MKISLALLVRNELPGCRIDVPQLPVGHFDEVYAIDGNSRDGTVEYLESQGIPVFIQPKSSLNYAYHHATQVSKCDAVVTFFPKGTIAPQFLLNFRPHLEAGTDLVVASRLIPGAQNEEDAHVFRPRKWGVQFLSLFCAMMWRKSGPRVRDVLHGVKGFTVSSFRAMQISESGVTVDLEMVVRSYRLDIPRVEFPVVEVARPHGQSNFPIFQTGKKLLRYLIQELGR